MWVASSMRCCERRIAGVERLGKVAGGKGREQAWLASCGIDDDTKGYG
jgi:hypothetical protein